MCNSRQRIFLDHPGTVATFFVETMIYELIKLINFGLQKSAEGKKLALATIIQTSGSSYRKKGTQMIMAEDLTYEGALSGGCVEKEVLRQSQIVFHHRENVIFEYDGRYKLGCNGIIYILIEFLEKRVLQLLSEQILTSHRARNTFYMGINKDRQLTRSSLYYSFGKEKIYVSPPHPSCYDEIDELAIAPQYQLVIIGGEFDSVILARLADLIGIQTLLVVKESFKNTLPQTVKVAYVQPQALAEVVRFDEQTAIVLMTHSLSKDLSYLMEMVKVTSTYLGILGPPARRETIMNDLMNFDETFFLAHQEKLENIHGPIGLNIGAKTPEEISISILGEIISVFNHQTSMDKTWSDILIKDA